MSKITFLAKIKLFISSHLVPVIATSAILVVGVSAGVVAIVINNQPKQETSSNQENTDLAQNSENEKPKQEAETDNKTENSDSSATNTDNKSAEQNTSKPNTSQNQNSGSSQTKPVEKPSNSNTNSNSNNSSSSQTPAPSQPNTPAQPTQPEKTVYHYVCLGTSNDPVVKQELKDMFSGGQDYMMYTFPENSAKITNCTTKLQSMSVPDVTKKLNWQLIEFNSAEELFRWSDDYLYNK